MNCDVVVGIVLYIGLFVFYRFSDPRRPVRAKRRTNVLTAKPKTHRIGFTPWFPLFKK